MSLQVNVAGLLKDAIGATRALDYDGPWEASEPSAVRVKARLTLMRTDRGVLVSGRVHLAFDAECSRCLVPFTAWTRLNIDEEYLPVADVAPRARVRPGEEENESFRIGERHELDLTEAIRQYGIAARPLAPVCQEECAGLCPSCGANLNDERCGCAAALTGPFEALKDLFVTANESR